MTHGVAPLDYKSYGPKEGSLSGPNMLCQDVPIPSRYAIDEMNGDDYLSPMPVIWSLEVATSRAG